MKRATRIHRLVAATLLGLVVTASSLLTGSTASAQNAPRRYQPARPTISPYINLFRRDRGPLPNYYTFVRPQLQQQQQNRQFQQQNNQLQRELQRQQGEIERSNFAPGRADTNLQFRPAPVAPTGGRSSFMTHSSYFQTYGAGAAGRGPARR